MIEVDRAHGKDATRAAVGAKDSALVATVILAWAGNFLFSKLALREFPALLFTALRLAVLALVLVPFIRLPPRTQWPRLVLVALSTGVVHFGLGFWGLRLSPTIGAPMIIMQTYAPLSVVLARVFYGERISLIVAAAMAISFAGILVLGFDPAILAAPEAMGLLLASSFFLALGTVLMRRLTGVSMPTQQGLTAWIGVGPLLVWSALVEPGGFATISTASTTAWIGVAYAALIVSLVGHGLFYLLVQRHPVARVTPYLLTAPVLTTLLGVIVLGDPIGPRVIIGGLLVLGGVLTMTRSR